MRRLGVHHLSIVHAVSIFLLPALTVHSQASCWALVVQSAIGNEAPVVVTGEIVQVDVAPAAARSFDIAHIRVTEIHKNELGDYPLQIGQSIRARMHGKNRQSTISTDLRYELGKQAIWYVYLNDDNVFSICDHVQQCRPVKEGPAIGQRREVLVELLRDGRKVARNPMTRAKWIARQKDRKARRAAAMEAEREQRDHIHKLRSALSLDGEFQEERMQAILDAPQEVRRQIVNSNPNSSRFEPMDEANFTRMQIALLGRDSDVMIRTLAASKLGYKGDYRIARKPLLRALASPDVQVRRFACQSIKQRADKTAAAEVRKLLDDEAPEVRIMAVWALGRIGHASDVPKLVRLYRHLPPGDEREYCYGDTLARLGEQELSLQIAVEQLKRAGDRYFTAVNLERIESPHTVPVAMQYLVDELRRSVEQRAEAKQTFLSLCRTLEARTELAFRVDTGKWLRWWNKECGKYGGEPIEFDEAEVETLVRRYEQKYGATRRAPIPPRPPLH